jgi:hypothetical protein
MDLHRRRLVLVRMPEDGQRVGIVKIITNLAELRRKYCQGRVVAEDRSPGEVRVELGAGHPDGGRGRGIPAGPARD